MVEVDIQNNKRTTKHEHSVIRRWVSDLMMAVA